MTHETVESAISAALTEINQLDCITEPAQLLRTL